MKKLLLKKNKEQRTESKIVPVCSLFACSLLFVLSPRLELCIYGILSADKGSTVNTTNFDWRWIGVILILLFVLFPSRETRIVLGLIGAAWMIQSGLEPWRAGRTS